MSDEYDVGACTELQRVEREVLEVRLDLSLSAPGLLTILYTSSVDPSRLPVCRVVEGHD